MNYIIMDLFTDGGDFDLKPKYSCPLPKKPGLLDGKKLQECGRVLEKSRFYNDDKVVMQTVDSP